MAEPFLPLTGLRVLAWEQAVSLPMATRLMADMGATVVRVESHARGRGRPLHTGNDLARNKQMVGLDFTHPEAREIMRRLVAKADVFCENFTPRVQRQFGLSYAELAKHKPDLIMLSLTGYGQTGDWSERPTYGPGIESAAGHAMSMGYPERPPMRPGTIVYADNISGFYAVLAMMGALHRRRATGKGAFIDLSMYEALAFHLGPSILRSSVAGRPEEPRGNGDADALIQGVYSAMGTERWLAVTVGPGQAGSLATLLGSTTEPAAMESRLREWAQARTAEDGADELQQVGIAASPVNNARDLHTDAQLRARESISMIEHAAPINGYSAHPHAASPWRVPGRPRVPLSEARAVGQDSRAVLGSWLGMEDEELNHLIAAGIVGGAPATPPEAIDVRPPAARLQQQLAWKVIAGYDPDPGATLGLPPKAAVR